MTLRILIAVLALVSAMPALAQPKPTQPDPAQLERARELFYQGNALREAGEYEAALAKYLESRALVASVPNTMNAALCLAHLERYDEALDLYEELVAELGKELDDANRKAVIAEIARLRPKVGSIDVVANVEAELVVDARPRGRLPRLRPVRVLPGKHVIRVLKEGYESFEKTVDVTIGESTLVEVKLAVLSVAGRMRIDDASLTGARVFVDGAPVGTVPWEGTLAPGKHSCVVTRGDSGSAPTPVVVVKGQTVSIAPRIGVLGRELSIAVRPFSAEILLNEVPVGDGRWRGRLPVGRHVVEAREEGYISKKRTFTVTRNQPTEIDVALSVDEDDPRWRRAKIGSLLVEGFGGVALAPSLGSGAEASCDDNACPSDGLGVGPLVGGRIGFEFPFGLAIEVAGGYVHVDKTLERRLDRSFMSAPYAYELSDDLRVAGGFVAGGVGFRWGFAEILELRARALVGALFASARDEVSASATGSGRMVAVDLVGNGTTVRGADLIVLPELHFGVRISGFGVSAGLTAMIFTLEGPASAHGDLVLSGCNTSMPDFACAPTDRAIAGERTFGPFVAWTPSLAVGYSFSL